MKSNLILIFTFTIVSLKLVIGNPLDITDRNAIKSKCDDKELEQFGFSGFNKLSVLPNLQISLLNHFRRLLRLHVNPFKVGSQLVKKPFVSKIFFVMVFTTPTSLSIFLSNKFPCMLQAQKLSVLYLLENIKSFT